MASIVADVTGTAPEINQETGLGTALCEDIHKGVFDQFRSLPIARSALLVGAVLGDTVRFATVMVILTGFGSALGFRTGVLPVLAAFTLAYVFYQAACWISVLIGLVAPSPETVQGIRTVHLPLPLSPFPVNAWGGSGARAFRCGKRSGTARWAGMQPPSQRRPRR